MKMLLSAIMLAFTCLASGSVAAQGLPDPPPPAVPATGSLEITAPTAGQSIGTATVVEGRAAPGANVEVAVNGELEQRLKVDQTGTFQVAVAGLPERSRVQIAVRLLDDAGEEILGQTISVKTGVATPMDEPIVKKETPPPPPAPVDDLERDVRKGPPVAVQPVQYTAPFSQSTRGIISGSVGILAGPVGAFLGALGAAFYIDSTNSGGGFGDIGIVILGGLLGNVIAVPTGVYLTGYFLDGDGSIALTVLGSLVGIVVGGLVLFAAVDNVDSDAAVILALLSPSIFGGVGGALAFELSSPPSRKAAQSVTVGPFVSPSAEGRGVVLGLSGRF